MFYIDPRHSFQNEPEQKPFRLSHRLKLLLEQYVNRKSRFNCMLADHYDVQAHNHLKQHSNQGDSHVKDA